LALTGKRLFSGIRNQKPAKTLQDFCNKILSLFINYLPPFIFPQGGNDLLLPPWGKAGKGVTS